MRRRDLTRSLFASLAGQSVLFNGRTVATDAGAAEEPLALAPHGMGYDVQRAGAVADGSTDCSAAFRRAASLGSALYMGPGTYRIASPLAIDVPCFFDHGAILKVDRHTTLTVNAPVWAGPWQIFDLHGRTSLAGAIRPMLYSGRVLCEWFGAKGDGRNPDDVAINLALSCARNSGFIGVQLLARTYLIRHTLYLNGVDDQSFQSCSLYGAGAGSSRATPDDGTIILCPGLRPAVISRGGSGATNHNVAVADIHFRGDRHAIGIEFAGRNGMTVQRCIFAGCEVGVQFANRDPGSFTEYCRCVDCRFLYCTTAAIRYSVMEGSSSFQGSGLVDCLINLDAGQNAVLIDRRCLVYNAPFTAQTWARGPNTLIQNDATGYNCSLHGCVTLEGGSPEAMVTLAQGSVVMFAGTVLTNSQGCRGGSLAQCAVASVFANREQIAGGRKTASQALGRGTSDEASPPFFYPAARLVHIATTGQGYDYRYVLLVMPEGESGGGHVTVLTAYGARDEAGYGPSRFGMARNRLQIINDNLPQSGVSALIDSTQISLAPPSLLPPTDRVYL